MRSGRKSLMDKRRTRNAIASAASGSPLISAGTFFTNAKRAAPLDLTRMTQGSATKRPWKDTLVDMLVGVDANTIVIGAGAAGLAAARSLAGRSVRVLVLEARDRVGGRVWSRPVARNATPAELGAEFIHGRGELTVQLLREAGAAAIATEGEGWTCSKDGELRREDWDLSSTAGIFEAAGALPDDESVDRFLRRFERDQATRETARAARAFVEGFDAADPAIASAQAIASEMRSGVDFAIARPLGGYGPMFEYLRNACVAAGVQIWLSTIVRRISWRHGAVGIDVNCGAWVGGPKAVALSGIVEAELMERALNGFGALFNEPELAREEFEGGLTHDWGRDPFARGAYSYVAVGGGNARAALSAPVDDTMFFAGEATSTDDQDGTVNGALETGERAAAEAATALGVEAR